MGARCHGSLHVDGREIGAPSRAGVSPCIHVEQTRANSRKKSRISRIQRAAGGWLSSSSSSIGHWLELARGIAVGSPTCVRLFVQRPFPGIPSVEIKLDIRRDPLTTLSNPDCSPCPANFCSPRVCSLSQRLYSKYIVPWLLRLEDGEVLVGSKGRGPTKQRGEFSMHFLDIDEHQHPRGSY